MSFKFGGRFNRWIADMTDRALTHLEVASLDVVGEKDGKRTDRLRDEIKRENRESLLANLRRFSAPEPDRLRPRIDEVVLR